MGTHGEPSQAAIANPREMCPQRLAAARIGAHRSRSPTRENSRLSRRLPQGMRLACFVCCSFACPFDSDVEGAAFWLSPWTFLEHVLRNRHCREDVGPANIEGEMGDRLRDLGLYQPVVHPDVHMAGQLRDLPGGDQRTDRD